MDQLMQVIMLWLSVTFGLPSVANPPTVQQLPGSTIASLRYGAAIEDRHDVLALYDRRTRTVILRQDWHSQSPADVSVLVHELVHHLQEQAGGKGLSGHDRCGVGHQFGLDDPAPLMDLRARRRDRDQSDRQHHQTAGTPRSHPSL